MLLNNFASAFAVPSDKVPLLDYKWSVTLNKPDGRELLDYGKGHSNGKLYFGRGVKFNGTDQSVSPFIPEFKTLIYTITVGSDDTHYHIYCGVNSGIFWVTGNRPTVYYNGTNHRINLILEEDKTYTIAYSKTVSSVDVYINGSKVAELEATTQTFGHHTTTIGSNSGMDDTMSNVIFMNQALTSQQISYQYKHPEKFLYSVATTQSDGSKTYSLQSEILTQDELDSVVAFLPMCETDKYVRNMVGYSEGVDTFDVTSYTLAGTQDEDNYVNIDDDGVIHLKHTDAIATAYFDMNIVEGEEYLLDVEVISGDGSVKSDHFNTGQHFVNGLQCMTATDTRRTFNIYRGTNNSDIYIKIKSIRKLTSTHQIENFTNSVRDEAMNLTYGLQTCFWKRDVLGVPYNSSFDRLNCDGVGYATIINAEPLPANYTIEVVINIKDTSKYQKFIQFANGIGVTNYTNGDFYIYPRYDDSNYKCVGIITGCSPGDTCHIVFEVIDDGATVKTIGYLNGEKSSDNSYEYTNRNETQIDDIGLNANKFDDDFSIKLLKVHTTPQDPLKLYNEAVRKGLLDD